MENRLLNCPKAILHTHLEGSVPPETLELLSQRNGIPLSFVPSDKIYKQIKSNHWESFRKIYFEICSCFKRSVDFYESLLNYGKKLRSENVVYAEVQFSPWKHISRGVSLSSISEGLVGAIKELETNHKITVRMITDLVRHRGEDCDLILDWLEDLPRKYFVALGVSGGSDAVDRIEYRKYCDRAKEIGLKITSHAGEIEDYNSVREVIEYWNTDRIGHGVRCLENKELLEKVIEKKIHFEICPTANKVTGLCKSNFDPIKDFISTGINFSINTDDELIFNTNILNEINVLMQERIISEDDIKIIQRNTLENSFVEQDIKDNLIEEYFQ
jgi:adenosine deaminase